MKNSLKPQPKSNISTKTKALITLASAGAVVTAFLLLMSGPDDDFNRASGRSSHLKGEIISTPQTNVLNPNGDNWITSTGMEFTSSEQEQNEVLWTALPFVEDEPTGDLATGAECGPTDVISNHSEKYYGSYFRYSDEDLIENSGDEYYMFRMRIGSEPGNAQFGYSVLMDVDNMYGVGIDPNAVSGNKGFEIELRIKNGGGQKGLYVDNIDGTTSGTLLAFYDLSTNTQISRSGYDCPTCGETYFYDFYIPFSVLSDAFGITSNSIVRFAGLTSSSGNSVISNNASDASGSNGKNATIDEQLNDLIDAFPQVAIGSGNGGVLPVELAKWNAYLDNDAIALEWTTMVEVNNDYFIVEKSLNGKEFTEVAQLKGQGNSSEAMEYIEYDYDIPSDASIVYYRLTQFDFDGKSKTFKTVPVKLSAQQGSDLESGLVTLKSYPNPFTNQITIDLEGMESGNVEIYDLSGKLIHQEQFTNKLFNISNLDQLKPGTYLLQVKDGGSLMQSTRIVKQ